MFSDKGEYTLCGGRSDLHVGSVRLIGFLGWFDLGGLTVFGILSFDGSVHKSLDDLHEKVDEEDEEQFGV